MNCSEARQTMRHLTADARPDGDLARHLGDCELCRQRYGDHMLEQTLAGLDVPEPSPAFLERALERALDQTPVQRERGWRLPSALAASFLVAIAALSLIWTSGTDEGVPAVVEVEVPAAELPAVHREEVRIVIHSRQAQSEAELSIELAGNLELEGYAGHRQLAWTTRLEQGANLLVLPVLLHNDAGEIRVRSRFGETDHEVKVQVARKTSSGDRTVPELSLRDPFAPIKA